MAGEKNEKARGLTLKVKSTARAYGAVLVGISSIDRFEPAPPFYDRPPEGHHPLDYLPTAQSVISVGIPILNPVVDAPAGLACRELEMIPEEARHSYFDALYNHVGRVLHNNALEYICQMVAQFLLGSKYESMIFPATGIQPKVKGKSEEEVWGGGKSKFKSTFGPFSHRHAAARAGLGEFGFNNLILTGEFGPRQRFNSIVTEAVLVPDPLLREPLCLRGKCGFPCLKACAAGAVTPRDSKDAVDYRSVAGKIDRSGVFIDTPSKTDSRICKARRENNPGEPVAGDCLRVCPLRSGRASAGRVRNKP